MEQYCHVLDKHNVFTIAKWCTLRNKEGGPLLEKVVLPPGMWQFWRGLALTVNKLLEHGYGKGVKAVLGCVQRISK